MTTDRALTYASLLIAVVFVALVIRCISPEERVLTEAATPTIAVVTVTPAATTFSFATAAPSPTVPPREPLVEVTASTRMPTVTPTVAPTMTETPTPNITPAVQRGALEGA